MTVMQSSPSEIFSNEIISPVSPLRGVLNSLPINAIIRQL